MKEKNIWVEISNFLNKNRKMKLISGYGQTFNIEEITEKKIKIKFPKGTILPLERKRFKSAYVFLMERRGSWIKIGASKTNTNPDTIEGRIKHEYDGKMNGLSTASWVATILVKTFDNIEFNGKKRGQAFRMR